MPDGTDKPGNPDGARGEDGPLSSATPAAAARRVPRGTAYTAMAVVVIGAAYFVWRSAASAPPVTTVAHLERLEPELVAQIKEQLETVRRQPLNARERATLGLIYEANGLWLEARACYKNATALNPREPMWPHHAAIAWLQTDDRAGATVWLREQAARFPTFAPLQNRLGVVLAEAGDLAGARAAFQKVVAAAPRNAHGYVGLGDVKLQNGDAAGAVTLLEKAVALDPQYKAARYLLGRAYRAVGRITDAERELTLGKGAPQRQLLDEWSRGLSQYAYGIGGRQNRAATLLKAGRPAEAAQILEQLLASAPDNVDILVNLGTAYLHLGRLEQARDVLTQAESLDDGRFATYVNLAACYRRLGLPEEALAYIKRALELAPAQAQAHHTHGVILMQMQKNDEALQALQTAAGYDAQDPRIQQDLANVFVRLRRYPEALEHYQTLARMLPTRWEPQLGLAKVNMLLGRIKEAKAAVEAGLQLAPNQPRLQAIAQTLTKIESP